jgi:Phytanoyl-CoA dioxygenase (PhyH)
MIRKITLTTGSSITRTELEPKGCIMAETELVTVRPFPQIERRQQIKTEFLRSLYGRTTNNELAFRWINRDFVRGLRRTGTPALSPVAQRVANDLQADGFALAEFSEFFPASFLGEIRSAFDHFRDEFIRINTKPATKGKGVFLDTIHKAHTFTVNDAVSTYLADPTFAAIAAHYMGMVPRYVGSSFWHTKPAPGDRQDSQLWHRDYNDRRLVKVFLYLNDVGQENGYFEYATGTHIKGPYGRKFDAIGSNGLRVYPDQGAIGSVIGSMPVIELNTVPKQNYCGTSSPWHGKPSVVQCKAPAGTLIFADTFGLHRGGYIKNGHRDMIMLTYSTNFNVHKPHFSVTPEFAATLNPFMKMAFGVA